MSQITFNPVQYGWVCPLCGHAHSPAMVTCFCASAAAAKVTKTTDTAGTPYPGVTVRATTPTADAGCLGAPFCSKGCCGPQARTADTEATP